MDSAGKVSLVTGGASGLGHATVNLAANPMLNGETIRLDGAIRMAPR
jgi:NADP-dependent 3-hydroxy acid dehydrogenase YdfG